MSTHTFPAPPPEEKSRQFDSVISELMKGELARSTLTSLSDLDRDQTGRLRSRWSEIPLRFRIRLVRMLSEIAEENVAFDFNRVFRIGVTDNSPLVRQLAIAGLWEDRGSDLPSKFFEIVEGDPSADVRAEAAMALAAACDSVATGDSTALDRENVINRFVAIARDPSESSVVRNRCLGTVAAFGNDPRVVQLIQDSLDDDDQAIVAGAIYAMGRTANSRWLPAILAQASSEDAELRFESARAAGLIGDRSAVPELANLATDADSEVRLAAIEALGKIGGLTAVNVLRSLAADEQSESVKAIEDALDEAMLTVDPIGRLS
jgi:HEAT repeats